jgi:hypothetical protein
MGMGRGSTGHSDFVVAVGLTSDYGFIARGAD